MNEGSSSAAIGIEFGGFRFFPGQRLLLEGDRPVRLGSRARDILLALLEQPARVVSKEDLLTRVWRNVFVEEGNLKVHVAALRRALGDGQQGRRFITNEPGRGYCFVAPVRVIADPAPAPVVDPSPPPQEPSHSVPAPLARMVGRSESVSAISAQLLKHRFVSIVGPGGIGKTTVALAVVDQTSREFPDGVRLVDLAALSDPHLVPTALASVLDVGVRSNKTVQAIASAVQNQRLLITLDSCEHLIDAVAATAEELFARAGPGLHILVTSREPLRVEGERVHRLPGLSVPPPGSLDAESALRFSAVQLFVERACANIDGFEFTDAEAPVVAELCRKLDGMALAIEIAAARVDAFGVAGLASRLDDRFRLMLRGRRTALPRHQTLSTTLDWSYQLLADQERTVLRRLSVLAGPFTMDVASEFLGGLGSTASDVVDCVANLVGKSLLAADLEGAKAQYRLLETTRAYAALKLNESGERDLLETRHAHFFLDALKRAETDWHRWPAARWLGRYRDLIDNIRAALDWAFSPSGEASLGIALTVNAVPLWFQLSLVTECSERVLRALSTPPARDEPGCEMRLHAALAWSLMQTKGSVPETRESWSKVLELSRRLGEADFELRALWGLWAGLLNNGEFRPALELATTFADVAARAGNTSDRFVGDRMIGYILHLLGQQKEARLRLERMIEGYADPVTGAEMIRYIFDQRMTARCFLARILWLQGHPDQASRLVDEIVQAARDSGDTLTLCQALVQAACPVALHVGDWAGADRFNTMLLETADRNGWDFWHIWGRSFRGALAARQGDPAAGLALLEDALGDLRQIQFGVYYIVFLADYANALGRTGHLGRAMVTIDEAISRSHRNEELWFTPELYRIKGELLAARTEADREQAETLFRQGLDLAREQQTPGWALRSATSLGRLLLSQGRLSDAAEIIGPVLAGYTEGWQTLDLRSADALLKDCATRQAAPVAFAGPTHASSTD